MRDGRGRTTDPLEVAELAGRLVGRRLGPHRPLRRRQVDARQRPRPDADRAIGRVNDVTGRGRHTSTSAVALPLPGGGWVVDTPGVRSFGLAHVDPQRVILAFPDLEDGTEDCPRGCTHDEEECALDAWAAAGTPGSGPARLESLRRLLPTRPPEPGALRNRTEPETP